MTATDWLFDGSVGLLLIVLSIAALYARSLYASVVVFIGLGLVLALTWARLGAPDLALAEAAIGAGLTGALLFSSLAELGDERPSSLRAVRWPAIVFVGLVLLLLLRAAWELPAEPGALPALVAAHLADSGVSHPVTAVLLNFRAWDTLLELLVLVLALLGVRQIASTRPSAFAPWPLLLAWTRFLAPLLVLVGGYLLWRGTAGPGGAFQAGALLAAGAVVLRLTGLLPSLHWNLWPLRLLVLLGFGVFLAVAIATTWTGEGWLTYPRTWNDSIILGIEIAATLSIAATLTLLIIGEPAAPQEPTA